MKLDYRYKSLHLLLVTFFLIGGSILNIVNSEYLIWKIASYLSTITGMVGFYLDLHGYVTDKQQQQLITDIIIHLFPPIYLLSYSDYSEVIPFYGQNRWVILGATIYQIIYYQLFSLKVYSGLNNYIGHSLVSFIICCQLGYLIFLDIILGVVTGLFLFAFRLISSQSSPPTVPVVTPFS